MNDTVVNTAFSLVFQAINACFGWFTSILDGEWFLLLISIPLFYMACRLILFPLFGSSSSDGVKDKSEDDDV